MQPPTAQSRELTNPITRPQTPQQRQAEEPPTPIAPPPDRQQTGQQHATTAPPHPDPHQLSDFPSTAPPLASHADLTGVAKLLDQPPATTAGTLTTAPTCAPTQTLHHTPGATHPATTTCNPYPHPNTPPLTGPSPSHNQSPPHSMDSRTPPHPQSTSNYGQPPHSPRHPSAITPTPPDPAHQTPTLVDTAAHTTPIAFSY